MGSLIRGEFGAANRMIGGNAPSVYLAKVQEHKQVKLDDAEMDAILRTHLIEPGHLRSDDFESFLDARATALLGLVEKAMGKRVETEADAAVDELDGMDGMDGSEESG